MISASVAESAVIAHGLQKLESNEQKRMRLRQSMENAKWMTMVNGLGLCLMSIKGRSKAQLVPMAMLLTGTCLFSNVIFMLFKDLIKIYKVYYVHVIELLERFPGLSADDAEKGFVMYQNFVNLTDNIKTKANKLIYTFNFPIQLPDFYNPEKGLVDTLRVVVE